MEVDTKVEDRKDSEVPQDSPGKVDDVEISEEPCEVDLTEDLYAGDNHEDIV